MIKPSTKPATITLGQAQAAVRAYLRGKPYTVAGLARAKCAHCSRPASRQWSLRPCAIGRTGWYPLCAGCDVTLNRVVMEFLQLPDIEQRLDAYLNRQGEAA